MSGYVNERQFKVVWMHPRGASLPDILTAVSDRTDKKDLRVFTEKPGTKSSVRQHIMQNTMRKAPCSFSHWLGEPVDIYFYPPPTVLVPGSARNKGNVAADALMINFDADKLTVDSHPVQPHGLCLVVGAGNLDDGDPPPRGIDVTKEMLCKLAATIGQLTPFLGDREKMEMVKKHWRWYDPAKGDQIEASGEVTRNGANLGSMVGADTATTKKGITYPADMIATTPSGLQYVVVKEGVGARKPSEGTVVTAHYCGWLDAFESDFKFDSSRDRRKEFQFQVGVGEVIKGWDEAVLDMKKKEQRMIIVPSELGYGDAGANNVIPPKATLYFHIELIKF